MDYSTAIEAYILLSDCHAQNRYYYWLHNQIGTALEWLQHEYSVHQDIDSSGIYDDSIFSNLNALG